MIKCFAPLTIILFSSFYWLLNYFLRVSKFNDEEEALVLKPYDFWIGIWTFILLLPLFPIYFYINIPTLLVIFSAGLPLVVVLILGWKFGKYSVSAMLIQSAHGAGIALLFLLDRLSTIQLCLDKAVTAPVEERLQYLSFCAEMSRFWFNNWLTISFALITAFGGAIISMYLLKPEDYGSKPSRKKISTEERQVLVILYSVSIIWMLLAGFAWVGVPSIQYLSRLADLQSMLSFGN